MKDRKAQTAAQVDASSNGVSWKVPVSIAEVPSGGRHFELKPDAAIRETIAKAADIVALPRLEASFDLTPHGSDSLRVVGRVRASIEQNCVVTLEPLKNEIDEEVDLLFAPPIELPKAAPADDSGEVAGSPAVDAPEELDNGTVDLAALTVEFLIIGIDPYPRKPGATFDAPPAGEPGPHPFAALAALKKGS